MLHEKSTQRLHRELKGQKANVVQHLHFDETFEVVDVEHDRIRLSQPVLTGPHSCWLHEDEFICLTDFGDGVFQSGKLLAIGDTVMLRNFVPDTDGICSHLTAHWKQKWCQISMQSPEQIGKVLDFAKAFLPRLNFKLCPLTIIDWVDALQRMKTTAARGADGISRQDMLALSARHLGWLVQFFNQLEDGLTSWPKQMLTGLVTCISKIDEPHLPDHYRPIHLFTVAHRIWASLRVRQLLRMMLPFVPVELHGFMPTKETTQVWFEIQCWIELALAQGIDWHGCSADIQKCFNCIERPAYFLLAEHLGTPEGIRRPWQDFLASFERRFQVLGAVSPPISSTRGFPEGCPLSILTMIHIGWGYHIFMKFFHPTVQSLSFVDNLDFHGGKETEIEEAVQGTQTWFLDFGLSLDLSKTFYWSTSARIRQNWIAEGRKVFTDTKELGGAMTMCRSVRNRALKARSDGLELKWKQLARSLAPTFYKIQMLATVFWPLALHGAAACPLAEGHLTLLRRAAIKAVGLKCAGANSYLRFLLLDKTVQDPSFWQHRNALLTFRRMLQKVPDVLQIWRIYHGHFHCPFLPGPYTKLLNFFSMVGWSVVDPPWIADHHGYLHNLSTQDKSYLLARLEDAWAQHVARNVKHAHMSQLNGIELALSRLDHHQLDHRSRLRVSAIQIGAFLSPSEHSKFDCDKSFLCTTCLQPDDRVHWHSCPKYEHIRTELGFDPTQFVALPDCTQFHLLVPQLAESQRLLAYLESLPDHTFDFENDTADVGSMQHLFTDGSCHRFGLSVSLAAWSVVNASSHELIVAAPLHGGKQTAHRAELQALHAAIAWGNKVDAPICLWSDSHNNVASLDLLIKGEVLQLPERELDLWTEIALALEQRQHLATHTRWIPAHLCSTSLVDEFETWISHWNDRADHFAGQANRHRDPLCLSLVRAKVARYEYYDGVLRQLRAFYLAVADLNEPSLARASSIEAPEAVRTVDVDAFTDLLPIGWKAMLHGLPQAFPVTFSCSLVELFLDWETQEPLPYWVSDVELVFVLASLGFSFPLGAPDGWKLTPFFDLFAKPPITQLLRPLSTTLDLVCGGLGLAVLRRSDFVCPELGIIKKGGATLLGVPATLANKARTAVAKFTKRRQFRSAQDFSRPLPAF